MLGGLDPIILFQFFKLTPSLEAKISKIPIVSSIVSTIGLPPIPLYLSEKLTGLYIDSEEKNIDIETTTETLSDGSDPVVNQKAINSVVRINLIASRDSIGLTLLSAIADLIVPKVTSKEYSITYLHGAVTVFSGLLHSFSITQNPETTLYHVSIELTKASNSTIKKAGPPEVKPIGDAATLEGGINATPPTAPLKTPLQGPPPQAPAPPPVGITQG